MLDKIFKYTSQPYLLLNIILRKIGNIIRYKHIQVSSYIKNIKLIIGKNTKFLQKMTVNGKGTVEIGKNCSFGFPTGGYYKKNVSELQPRFKESKILFGDRVSVNNNLLIISADEVHIGDKTLIGEGVMILDLDAHGIMPSKRRTSRGNVKPVLIGENCWIGSRVTILPGTIIGNNSIVGAGAVVKGHYPENVILAGNPARIIKTIMEVN